MAGVNPQLIQTEFQQPGGLIFLNHAAVAPWPTRTATAVAQFAAENASRGPSNYAAWEAQETTLRRQLATLINARSADEIALAKSTSEALSFIAAGIRWQRGDQIVTFANEFPSNRMPWEVLESQGVELIQVPLQADGDVDIEDALCAACTDATRLLSISSVQYACGTKSDLRRIGSFCRQHEILFCVDAIQSLGALQFDVQDCYADFVVADGHKWMLGPEGLALFFVRRERLDELRINEFGWHMTSDPADFDNQHWQPAPTAKRFECGSANMLGAQALSASLSLLLDIGLEAIETVVLANSAYLHERLSEKPELTVITSRHERYRSGIVSFRPLHQDMSKLHKALRQHEIVCAVRGGGIRWSPHFYISREQLDRALVILTDLLNRGGDV